MAVNENPLTRLLAWLGSIISGKKADAPIPPLFTVLEEKRWENGMLRRVQVDARRRPNSACTYLFIPYRKQGQISQPDWLVCCDLLEGRGTQRVTNTHQVTVLSIPHFAKNLDGVTTHYSKPWDLQGRSHYRDHFVLCIMARVAGRMRTSIPTAIDWHRAIEQARAECWGGVPVLAPPPLPGNDIYADPYDPGTRRTRIKLRSAWWLLLLWWLDA